MTSAVQRVVETVFKTVDGASAPLRAIAGAGVSAGSALASIVGPLAAVTAGLASMAGLGSTLNIASEFEQTQNALGGMLSALGFAAGGDPTERFNNGLDLASETMDRITAAAARLPGEAEDYIAVFRSALPTVQNAVTGGLEDLTNFTNQLTAIGRTFSIDAGQIGRDTATMLRAGVGGAGADVRTFQELLPYMRTLEGQANLTAQQFNAMTAPDRARLLEQTFEKLRPMLDRSAESFASMLGGLKSGTRMMLRMATTPIFDAAKHALSAVNARIMDSNGNLTEQARHVVAVGQRISTWIVGGFNSALHLVDELTAKTRALGAQIAGSPWMRQLMSVANRGIDVGLRVGAAVGESPAAQRAVVGIAARAVLGPWGAIVGPLIAFGQHTAQVNQVMTSFTNILNTLFGIIEPTFQMFQALNELGGELIAMILPGFMSGLEMIAQPLVDLWNQLMGVATVIMGQLRPYLLSLAQSVGNLFSAIGEFLNPVIRLLGVAIMWLYEKYTQYLLPITTRVIDAIRQIIDAIAWVLRKLGRELTIIADRHAPRPGGAPGAPNDHLGNMMASMQRAVTVQGSAARAQEAAAEAIRRRANTPAARGGNRTHNDFRNSRFSIEQRFAEGFDPDRIAAAFANDLERVANQRLQSGLEPVFGVN